MLSTTGAKGSNLSLIRDAAIISDNSHCQCFGHLAGCFPSSSSLGWVKGSSRNFRIALKNTSHQVLENCCYLQAST